VFIGERAINYIKMICRGVFVALVLLLNSCNDIDKSDVDLIKNISDNYRYFIKSYNDTVGFPRSIVNEKVKFVNKSDWTSGFFSGCLWYVYELTNDTIFANKAIENESLLESEKFNNQTHDIGFKLYCSYGNAYRITQDSAYREILLQGAKTLKSRYNPNVGCIRSWNHHQDIWQFPVIIDNMMNLELLFFAFRETGDSVYYNIATSHADKTIENHFRKDFSTYHVVDYDTITGKVLTKQTHQGYSDASSWARGQAWSLYGFTVMYRETKDYKYLQQANSIAKYLLTSTNLDKGAIPYWDLSIPDTTNAYKDVSSATIISSALLELSTFDKENCKNYYAVAMKIISTLSSDDYFDYKNEVCPFLLKHSVGNIPKNIEVDKPIVFADYYFLESLIRADKFFDKHYLCTRD
jgi:rhamnogalacturonyl hydrolase YesR